MISKKIINNISIVLTFLEILKIFMHFFINGSSKFAIIILIKKGLKNINNFKIIYTTLINNKRYN